MSEKLFESDFLTVDLTSLFNSSAEEQSDAVDSTTADTDTSSDAGSNTDTRGAATKVAKDLPGKGEWAKWGELLKKRLADNKNNKRSQKTDLDIENKFFTDFYNVCWPNIAGKLNDIGIPLRRALKTLGFNPNKGPGGNPILAFIIQPNIQELIQQGLINASTFRAIYNAVAEPFVSDYEFFAANNYNIIYCADLYKRPVTEIVEYLRYQKEILAPTKNTYTKAECDKNRKTFLFIDEIKTESNKIRKQKVNELRPDFQLPAANNQNTILNSINFVKEMIGTHRDSGKGSNAHMSASAINKFVQQITQGTQGHIAEMYAAILHFSLTTEIPEVKQALKHEKFQGLSGAAISQGAAAIAPYLNKGRIPDSEVKSIVAGIMSKLA